MTRRPRSRVRARSTPGTVTATLPKAALRSVAKPKIKVHTRPMARFTMSVREGPRFSRIRTNSIDELYDELAFHAEEVSARADGNSVDAMFKTFEPIERVYGRIEI